MTPEADFMRRAIGLARAQLGLTGENPAVGCVIAKDGQVVGEGATAAGGRPHAEELALAQAGARAKGAIAYVTLEPCGARSGEGVACSLRLVDAGVAEVVVACEDASPFAAGRGIERLRVAGVPVRLGLLAEEASDLYRDYTPPGK